MEPSADTWRLSATDEQQEGAEACPVCGSSAFETFFEIPDVPVLVGFLWPTREQAYAAPTGAIALAYCRNCQYIGNRAFDPNKISYTLGYEVSLHHSPLYRAFLRDVATELVTQYGLHDKSILEIGCGKGYFLRLLCQIGGNQGIGIDPSVEHEGVHRIRSGKIKFIRDYYSERYANLESDFICCRQVLHSLPDPKRFVNMVRSAADRRSGAVVYVEVPNASYVFRNHVFWTVFYEHRSYFTPEALSSLFERSGFEVLCVTPRYEAGQYLSLEAVARESVAGHSDEAATALHTVPEHVLAFAKAYQEKVEGWTKRLAAMQAQQRRAVAWGSGGRGITFLNALKTQGSIAYVVDINPDRHGRYVPGTGQQVVPPEFLLEYKPEIIIVTNPTYDREIRQQVASMGLTCEFATV